MIGLNSNMIQSIVIAIIVFLVQLLFLEFLILANATMQRAVRDHAEFGGGNFTSITLRVNEDLANPGTIHTLSQFEASTNCKSNTVIAAGAKLYSEDGNAVSFSAGQAGDAVFADSTPTCVWNERPVVVEQFSAIIEIIGEIIPLLLVVAVSSEAFMLMYLRGSQGGITAVVGTRVALLVIAYVVILFAPTLFDFSEDALSVFVSNAITGTDRFEQISKLLLSLIPLAYELLVLAILGWNTYSTARAVRSRASGNRRPQMMAGLGR